METHGKEQIEKVLSVMVEVYKDDASIGAIKQLHRMVSTLDEEGVSALMCMYGADATSINTMMTSVEHEVNVAKVKCQKLYGTGAVMLYEFDSTLENLTLQRNCPDMSENAVAAMENATNVIEDMFHAAINTVIISKLLGGVMGCELQGMSPKSSSDVKETDSKRS